MKYKLFLFFIFGVAVSAFAVFDSEGIMVDNTDKCLIRRETEDFRKSFFPFEFKDYSTGKLLPYFHNDTRVDSVIVSGGYPYKVYNYRLGGSYVSFLVKEDSEYFYLLKGEIRRDMFKPGNGVKIGMRAKSFFSKINSVYKDCKRFFIAEGDMENVYQFDFENDRLHRISINYINDLVDYEVDYIEGRVDPFLDNDSILSAYVRLMEEKGIMNFEGVDYFVWFLNLTDDQADSVFYQYSYDNHHSFSPSEVKYSPDSVLRFYTITEESCGAYCNDEKKNWVYYSLFPQETRITKTGIGNIMDIYKLKDGNYLVISEDWGRPASVYTVYCNLAYLVSLTTDSLAFHPVQSFCQRNGIPFFMEEERDPYIRYDEGEERMYYLYGDNYLYSDGLDVDTIREGSFKYVNGEFVFENETIQVYNWEM